MKVWLDDEREMPDSFDVHVKTADECIKLLESGCVDSLSLDHDLGGNDPLNNGYEVAKWIEQNCYKIPKINISVHTQNPVGLRNINMALNKAIKYWMSL